MAVLNIRRISTFKFPLPPSSHMSFIIPRWLWRHGLLLP